MIRRLRLASGLVMLAYVTMHLANHAAGLVSLAVMERVLSFVSGLWSIAPAQLLLYGSFAVHYVLALLALWERRTLRLRAAELFQLALGFLIPVLLLRHVAETRLAYLLFGTETRRYVYLLWVYFVRSPEYGFEQLLVLVVAWAHAMLGLHFWLKVKPRYARVQSPALVFAVLFPVLALLGAIEAGRQVAAFATERHWTGAVFAAMRPPTPDEARTLGLIVTYGTWFFVALVAAVLLARLMRRLAQRRRGLVRIAYPDGRFIEVARGTSVLEASRLARIPHASICGGRGRCSTCRVRVRAAPHAVEPPGEGELRVLRRIRATPSIRLACMLRPLGTVEVTPLLPPFAAARDGRGAVDVAQGKEREIAILFVDIRDFTALAESRLPYDVVFILNRYFAAIGGAVEGAGGRVDKFIGDGVMALFGIESEAEAGCRQALVAARAISERLVELNAALAGEIETPLRIGVGIHVGAVILGEMGYGTAAQLTAIGDAVNIASRLESLTKGYGVELVLSEDTAA
ncbi:MAG TPA: adenylate/guanylate cyclase domain-containing protein, partial [Stellaceae bacterium]|nr:adenylate/guanylate cyclase domain-containing protein [Stellaceae bacterium]